MSVRTDRRRSGAICRAVFELLETRRLLARFAIIGDMIDNSRLTQVANLVKSWNPDHVVTSGDNDNLTHTRYEDTVGRHFHNWMSPYPGSHGPGSSTGNRFWPSMGNHDWESNRGSADYTDYFTLPGVERYYNVRLGNTEFFMLDSDQREPHGTSPTSTQGNWLRNALSASTAQWKLVVSHHPPYSSGTSSDATWMRWPYKDWGATAVISGHHHLYERLSVNGTPYIINSTAGGGYGGFGSIDSNSIVRYSGNDGAMLVDALDSTLTMRFYNRSGTLIDSVTVNASVSAPAAPSNLAASAVSQTQVNLNWNDNSNNEDGFRIERSLTGTGSWSEIATVGAGVTNYGDTGRSAGTTYYYRVRAFNTGGGNSAYSNTASATTPSGNEIALIPANAVWKYLDNGSNQGTAWRGVSFNDSSWNSGAAELGYGDGDEATVISFGPSSSNKFITTYFRKSFDVSSPGSITALTLRLVRDDGAVVYLNGNEIYRSNMPGGTITHTTLASSAISGAAESQWLEASISPSLLQSGTNVLAVEIHQDRADSSDKSFNAELRALGGGTTVQPPTAPSSLAASAVSQTQINLSWADNSNNETGFKIERSLNGSSGWSQIGTTTAASFADTIGLSSGTTYYYRVRAYNSGGDSSYTNVANATTHAAPTGQTVYLSDIAWVSATNGWGPVERDQSNGEAGANDGGPITLNGVVYAKGLGAHAHSTIVYNLGGQYASFLSDVGVDDRQTTNGSIVFQVFVDGTKVFDSGVMRPTTATKSVNVSVAGAQELRLVITDAGDGINYDHGDWAGARLLKPSTTTTKPSAPSGLQASAVSSSQINLSWIDTSTNETGFRVYRSTNGTSFSAIGTTTGTTFQDTALAAATTYYYRVYSYNSAGESSGYSAASAATQPANNPSGNTFIPLGSAWKYLDNGSDQGLAWRGISFNDSSWKTGNGEFGYGDGDETTVVSFGPSSSNKFITTYFRKSFSVADASAVTALAMRLIRDDGAVVYLNGTEVFRNNMPGGTITYTTLASGTVSGAAESTFLSASLNHALLVTGTNVIAVEIHQDRANSSDMSFEMELTATLSAGGTLSTSGTVLTKKTNSGTFSTASTPGALASLERKDLLDSLLV